MWDFVFLSSRWRYPAHKGRDGATWRPCGCNWRQMAGDISYSQPESPGSRLFLLSVIHPIPHPYLQRRNLDRWMLSSSSILSARYRPCSMAIEIWLESPSSIPRTGSGSARLMMVYVWHLAMFEVYCLCKVVEEAAVVETWYWLALDSVGCVCGVNGGRFAVNSVWPLQRSHSIVVVTQSRTV